jgi:cytochrome c oxidase subunit 2
MHDAYVVFAVIAVILAVAVNVALVVLVRRFRAARGREPAPRAPGRAAPLQFRLLSGLAALAALLLVLGIVFDDRARGVPKSAGASKAKPPLSIRAAGQQWLWRYTYPDGTFSYHELVVPAGRAIRLAVDSTDVVHRWWVPSLAGMAEAVPGRLNTVWFRADEPGVYEGRSTAFSGASYAAMRTRVRAVSDAEFTAWLEKQRSDLIEAQSAVQKAVGEQGGQVSDPSAALTPGVAGQSGATP